VPALETDGIAHAEELNRSNQSGTRARYAGDWFERVNHLLQNRRAVWALVAVLCVAVGAVVSVLSAHSVASTDAQKARVAFHLSSAEVASTLKLDIQHEQDLALSASTFFAANPQATQAEFTAWARSVRPLRDHLELEKLSLVGVVRAIQLTAFRAQTGDGFHVVPADARPFYCLTLAEVARFPSAGVDYCAATHRLLLNRDSGLTGYLSVSAGHSKALSIATPVYLGGVTPSTEVGRKAAFVGWVRQVTLPSVVLGQALHGHPQNAVSLHYAAGASNVVLAAGTPHAGGQSRTIDLHDGWVLDSFGAPATAGVFSDIDALAHLLAGLVLSVLLGLLVFLLGTRRERTPAPVSRPAPHAVPNEELYDVLTGLPNRSLMVDRAQLMLARAGRESTMLAGALFIDIDAFNDVNAKLGPAAGDQLLNIIAERLKSVVRGQDTVGRLGGDEFVVLVESATARVRLDALARRIIEALHRPVELDEFEPSLFLTASIGVAFGRYATAEDLLRDAQLALYSAKAAGKDRYTLFNASMRSVIEGRGLLEVELNTAVKEHQFLVLYEPIYGLSNREIVGLQALLRWRHPTRGVLAPEEFIDLAEETGLIVPIGRWLLQEACTRTAEWNTSGRNVGISVRVSDRQLARDGFATDVGRALEQSGIEPSLLTLEISENALMRDVAATAARLTDIKLLGACIAVGDFGSDGYAHQSELQNVPADFLKVDRSSIVAADGEDYRSWLLEAILTLGQDLSMGVIANGIESREHLTTLQAMGYTMAQGSFMGRPTEADAVQGLFEAPLPKRARAAFKSLSH
jgi:diguanylate cyclase (GGDEF)-like protein